MPGIMTDLEKQPAAVDGEHPQPVAHQHHHHHLPLPHLPHHSSNGEPVDLGVEAHMDSAELETAVVEVQSDGELERDAETGAVAVGRVGKAESTNSPSSTPTTATAAESEKAGATAEQTEQQEKTDQTNQADQTDQTDQTDQNPEEPPQPALTAAERAELMYARFSPGRKRFLCAILAMSGVLSPLSTTGSLTALEQIAETYHTSGSVINISNGLYTGAMGVSAFIWGVTGVLGGRRIVLLPNLVLFTLFSMGNALAPNLSAFYIFRILSGFSGTALLVGGPAVVGDIYTPTQRGTALAWIMSGALIGPAIGPTIGGIIVTYSSWRNIYWFQTGLGGLATILAIAFLPETAHARRWDTIPRERRLAECAAAYNPWRLVLLFRRPDLFLVALASSSLIWNMYAFFAPIVYVINPRLHFTKPLQAGLFYLAPGFGYLTATFFGGRNADRVVKKWIRKRDGVRRPQDRLRAALPWMGFGTPACMLIYGWCLQYNKGGIALLVVVMFIQGFTQLMIFPAVNTYCIDVVPGRSTEVLGGNYFIRYMFGAAGTALAIPATDGIGIGWFCTISTAFILCAWVGVVLVIYDKVPFARKLNADGTLPPKEEKSKK